MDEVRGALGVAAQNGYAAARGKRKNSSLALAGARSAHSDRCACQGGGVMQNVPRASRFIHAGDRPRIGVSFEFFPPRTEDMETTLWDSITRLAPLAPNFVSVTYGAGGSTRERTHSTVKRILSETALTPAAHLTCVAAICGEIDAVIRNYCAAGVRHIVALRGDPVGGVGERYA